MTSLFSLVDQHVRNFAQKPLARLSWISPTSTFCFCALQRRQEVLHSRLGLKVNVHLFLSLSQLDFLGRWEHVCRISPSRNFFLKNLAMLLSLPGVITLVGVYAASSFLTSASLSSEFPCLKKAIISQRSRQDWVFGSSSATWCGPHSQDLQCSES